MLHAVLQSNRIKSGETFRCCLAAPLRGVAGCSGPGWPEAQAAALLGQLSCLFRKVAFLLGCCSQIWVIRFDLNMSEDWNSGESRSTINAGCLPVHFWAGFKKILVLF